MKAREFGFILLGVLLLFLLPCFVWSDGPFVSFVGPTPVNGSVLSVDRVVLNVSVNSSGLDSFRFDWNGSDSVFYNSSLVLAMNFNNYSAIGDNSTYVADISQYENNGTVYDRTWTSQGFFDGAYGGTSGYIMVPITSSLNLTTTDEFTASAWVKFDAVANLQGILGIWDPDTVFVSYIYGDKFYGIVNNNPDCEVKDQGPVVLNGYWYYVTLKSNSTHVYLYVNGTLVGTSSGACTNINPSSTTPLGIGNAYNGGSWSGSLKGIIDEVRIYNRALSDRELVLQYQAEFQKYSPSEYRFYDELDGLENGSYTYYCSASDIWGNVSQTDNGTARSVLVQNGSVPPTTTTTTLPLSVVLNGVSETSVGGNVSYSISLSNPNNIPKTFNLSVSGLDTGWYVLGGSSGLLNAHEEALLSLDVSVPIECNASGTYPFNVSTGENSSSAVLNVSSGPIIGSIFPADSVTVSSVDLLFSWRTSSDSTSVLYIKSDNESMYWNISGDSGLLDSITATNLSRNTGYSWYAESCSACGCTQSLNRSFYVDNGVSYTQRTYSCSVERDYNQHTSVAIHNTDTSAHTLLLEAINPYDDLIVGFTGNGSVDQNVTVQPEETAYIDLMVHAQDAVLADYYVPVSLKNLDDDNITDNAIIHVHVNQPDINFTITEVSGNQYTLAKKYVIHNYGDTLTDLMVYADDSIKSNVTFNPAINHGKLDSGASVSFEVIPVLYENFTDLSGMIYAKDPETVFSAEYNGTVPNGSGVFPVVVDDGELCVRMHDWYCTNRPDISVRFGLPSVYDSLDVYDGELFTSFTPYSDVRNHSVYLGMNGLQIGSLEDMVPNGLYNFSFPGSYMHGGSNLLGILTVHLNGGHYVVAADMRVCSCVKNYSAWVVALDQAEAEGYVNNLSLIKKVPDNISVEILSPAAGETINTTNVLIRASIYSPLLDMAVVAHTCDDAVMLLYDDGQHDDGAANDNVYAYTWNIPSSLRGNCTISVRSDMCDVTGTDSVDVRVRAPTGARIVSFGIDKPMYTPGSTIIAAVNLTTNVSFENVTVEVRLFNGTEIFGASDAQTPLTKDVNTGLILNIAIPSNVSLGEYSVDAIIYDVESLPEDNRSTTLIIGSGELFCSDSFGDIWMCVPSKADCQTRQLYQECNGSSPYCFDSNGFPVCLDNSSYSFNVKDIAYGAVVFRQPSDYVTIVFLSVYSQSVGYETNLLEGGACLNGLVSLPAGSVDCKFRMPSGGVDGYLRTPGKEIRIKSTTSPDTVFVTDRGALLDRFGNVSKAYDVLSKVNLEAGKRGGVVYYLDDYLTGRPWSNFDGYHEDPKNPDVSVNSYASQAATFSRQKCGSCKNIVIVGDDFVVPHYRNEYSNVYDQKIWDYTVSRDFVPNYLYTDSPYIKTKSLPVADIETMFETKKVKVILPDSVSQFLRANITVLEATLTSLYNVEISETTDAGCDDYSLGDYALVLIGDRTDNAGIKCIPVFDIGSEPGDTFNGSIQVERNVWGPGKYAVVLSGSKPEKAVFTLNDILQNPFHFRNTNLKDSTKLFIREFSSPPELPVNYWTVFEGIAVGNCEKTEGSGKAMCVGGDVIANLAPPFDAITSVRDMGIYCGTSVYSGVSGETVDSMDGAMCVFSGAGGVTTLGKYVGATSVVGLIGEEEASAITTGLKRIIKTTKETFGESFQMFKFLDELKLFKDLEMLKFLKIEARIDPAIVEEIVKGVTKFEQITVQHRLQFNKLLEYFNSESDLQILHEAVGDIDDYEDIVIGTEKALGQGDLSRVAGGAINEEEKLKQAECLRDLGTITPKETKISGEITQADYIAQEGYNPENVVDWSTNIIDVDGVDEPVHQIGNLRDSSITGYIGEVRVSEKLRVVRNDELIKMSHKLPVGQLDLVYKESSMGEVIAAEIKEGHPKNWNLDKLKGQMDRYKAMIGQPVNEKTIEKVQLISIEEIDPNIKTVIQGWGNIEIIDGIDKIV